jgi:hypothetical protein
VRRPEEVPAGGAGSPAEPLSLAVLDATGRGWPWPFDALEEAERAALLAWALALEGVGVRTRSELLDFSR